jgi:hypothetical protein
MVCLGELYPPCPFYMEILDRIISGLWILAMTVLYSSSWLMITTSVGYTFASSLTLFCNFSRLLWDLRYLPALLLTAATTEASLCPSLTQTRLMVSCWMDGGSEFVFQIPVKLLQWALESLWIYKELPVQWRAICIYMFIHIGVHIDTYILVTF